MFLNYCVAILGICRLTSTVGSNWYIYAWEDPHTEDLTDPNIQSSFVAEDS